MYVLLLITSKAHNSFCNKGKSLLPTGKKKLATDFFLTKTGYRHVTYSTINTKQNFAKPLPIGQTVTRPYCVLAITKTQVHEAHKVSQAHRNYIDR